MDDGGAVQPQCGAEREGKKDGWKEGGKEGDAPHARTAAAGPLVRSRKRDDDHFAPQTPVTCPPTGRGRRAARDERLLLSRFLMHRLSELILSFKSGSVKAVSASKPLFCNARSMGLQQANSLLHPKGPVGNAGILCSRNGEPRRPLLAQPLIRGENEDKQARALSLSLSLSLSPSLLGSAKLGH